MTPSGYPPEHHILGDLGIEVDTSGGGHVAARLGMNPHLLDATGGVRIGVLATLVDVVGGALGARACAPDWIATADMAIQSFRPATGPVIEARGAVLRKGRTTMVVEVFVFDLPADASPAAWATMTFAVLPEAGGGPVSVDRSTTDRHRLGRGTLDRSVADAASITEGDRHGDDRRTGELVSMPVHDYVRNSFGAVQGGVTALLGDVAGTLAVRTAHGGGPEVRTVELQIAYLAQGRVGPMVAHLRSVFLESGVGRAVIELIDEGADRRLSALISTVAEPV